LEEEVEEVEVMAVVWLWGANHTDPLPTDDASKGSIPALSPRSAQCTPSPDVANPYPQMSFDPLEQFCASYHMRHLPLLLLLLLLLGASMPV